MTFSKDIILSLVILAVVLEADLGHKKIAWFRIARPFIVGIALVPSYLTKLPTSGHDLLLQGAGALTGILLGLTAVSAVFVAVGFDPDFRSRWAKIRHKPGEPAAVSVSGTGYALFWIAATAARLIFAWTSQHAFPHALQLWLHHNQLAPAALTNALIFLPLGMDIFRSVGLLARGASPLRQVRLQTQTTSTR